MYTQLTLVLIGWDEGVKTMNKGERARLVIDSEHGYGEMGNPPSIPPNAALVFDIELLDHRKADLVKTGTNFL